ncbi:hypothetical protein APA_3524 [Pseudanabaena sp. lw0831]|nr:hypothetical protein APA_3524 [Pseudanabaena sp. lw0831]
MIFTKCDRHGLIQYIFEYYIDLRRKSLAIATCLLEMTALRAAIYFLQFSVCHELNQRN